MEQGSSCLTATHNNQCDKEKSFTWKQISVLAYPIIITKINKNENFEILKDILCPLKLLHSYIFWSAITDA